MLGGVRKIQHPAWVTAIATAGGWLLMLAVITVFLFLVPYALWP
jgi:hypothetical protein